MADSSIFDPLERRIILHDRTWYGHILKGHSDMQSLRPSVENAVRSPRSIRFSASDPDCRLYYGDAAGGGMFVAVVADVVRGFVKTAYRAAREKGDLEWSR